LLTLSAPSIDLGALVTKTTLAITNDGDQPLTWSFAVPADSSFTIIVNRADSPLAPGATANIGISFARTDPASGVRLPEGRYVDTLTLSSNAGAAMDVALAATVETPPIVEATVSPGQIFLGSPNCIGNEQATQATVSVFISDESPIKSAEVGWDQSITPLTPLAKDPTMWSATIGPWLKLPTINPAEITIQVTDDRGNTTTVLLTLTISDCPQ